MIQNKKPIKKDTNKRIPNKDKKNKKQNIIKKTNKINDAIEKIKLFRNKIKLPNNIQEIMIQKTEKSIDFALRSLHHTLTATSLFLQASKEATETSSWKETSNKVSSGITNIKNALLDWKSFMSTMSNISNKASDFFKNLSITTVAETLLVVAEKSGQILSNQLSNITEAIFSKGTTEQLKITANLFTNLLKNLFQISKRLIGHALQFISGIASSIFEVVYDFFEYSLGGYFSNKLDLSKVFSSLSSTIISKFQKVLSSSSGSFKNFPKIYNYIIGTSMFTSPAIYAGGFSIFYRFMFPVLGGLVSKVYEEIGSELNLPFLSLAVKPIKFLSNL